MSGWEFLITLVGIGTCCIFALSLGSYVCFKLKKLFLDWITKDKEGH